MEKVTLDLEEISATVVNLFPKLNKQEQIVSVQLYRLLAGGQPVSRERLAETLHIPIEAINTILDQWWGIYYDEHSNIIGYWGLALPKMPHRFDLDGRTIYTWCAWDTLFIPQILQKTARIQSTCPVTREKIRLIVAPYGVKQIQPASAVMSFVTPEFAKIRENVVANFCHYVYFFSSTQAASAWTSENPGTFILSIEEASYLGRRKNEAQYHEVLGNIAHVAPGLDSDG
jgi:alkylmercury lyase